MRTEYSISLKNLSEDAEISVVGGEGIGEGHNARARFRTALGNRPREMRKLLAAGPACSPAGNLRSVYIKHAASPSANTYSRP
jgi:hypothetical protein